MKGKDLDDGIDRLIGRQKQTDRQTDRQRDRQTERQTDRQTDIHTDKHTDGWTDRQSDIQTNIPTDRRTDGRTYRQTININYLTVQVSIIIRRRVGLQSTFFNIDHFIDTDLVFILITHRAACPWSNLYDVINDTKIYSDINYKKY